MQYPHVRVVSVPNMTHLLVCFTVYRTAIILQYNISELPIFSGIKILDLVENNSFNIRMLILKRTVYPLFAI